MQLNPKPLLRGGGGNRGKPEFIVRKSNSDVVIVVECKADIKKHESLEYNKPKDFAVDGVLHYASFLKEKFNVIAIAVSGENPKNILTSFFIWKKNDPAWSAKPAWRKFAEYEVYFKKFHKPENLFSLNELRKYTHDIHNRVRQVKLKEAEKPLLIGGILLALDEPQFCNEYKTIKKSKKLASRIIEAIGDKLDSSSIEEKKKKIIVDEFKFIKNEIELLKENERSVTAESHKQISTLHYLVFDFHEKIYPIMDSAENIDLMSEFYKEFIRYSGGDGKGLGVILTPSHITELFTSLAGITKNHQVLDICMGTGGFLVASMAKMLEGDLDVEDINNIRKNNLHGVEVRTDLFSLACVNMFIRGDGKANMYHGNCFNLTIPSKKYDAGLINPPYSQRKEPELKFVDTLLNMLKVNGMGIVILPVSVCGGDAGGSKINQIYRKKILEKHTLISVMDMPTELFSAGTHTCIMVFSAHVPHDSNKSTWLALWNDDGHVKQKNQRTDRYSKWMEIKKEWLCMFDKKQESSKSINKKLDYRKEWSVLEYLPTNYGCLTIGNFKQSIREHRLCVMRRNKEFFNEISEVLNLPINEQLLFSNKDNSKHVNIKKWDFFIIDNIFTVHGSKTTPVDTLYLIANESGKKYPYVTTKATNTGIDDYFPKSTDQGNILTVDSATNGHTTYRLDDFTASDHVEKLIPKFDMNKYIGIFIETILKLETFRYGYGRKFNQTRIKNTRILLPKSSSGKPDWEYMTNFIKNIDELIWFKA